MARRRRPSDDRDGYRGSAGLRRVFRSGGGDAAPDRQQRPPRRRAGDHAHRHLVRQPWWLAGIVISVVGAALHATALSVGSLTLVQPVLVTGVVFALAMRSALDRRAPSAATVGWAALTAGGLAVFLLSANTTAGHQPRDNGTAAATLTAGVVVAAAASIAARRRPARPAGALLGLATGILFGLVAGVLKATVNEIAHGGLLTGWPLYALIVLGLWGLFLNQRAYHVAPLAISLPILNIIDPSVAILFGAVVFGERPADQPLAVAIEVVGVTAMAVGVLRLYRAELGTEAP